jgi:CHASE3 domain sensor protein
MKKMNQKMKGTFIIGLVLFAAVASMYLLTASAAVNGNADQTRDRTQDKIQDKDCLQDKDCSFDCTKDQLRTRLQIRDC